MEKSIGLLLPVIMVLCFIASPFIAGGVFGLIVMLGDDRADKVEVMEFVCEKEEELLQAIETGSFVAFENQGFIQDIDEEVAIVDFDCGGAGVGSGTSYVGFYYTPDHDMTAIWCVPSSVKTLKPYGDGFMWQEYQGDNRYYTEHICGNFYYYEASF